ncbi:hypothetical protein M885DRAFT_116538 [Pelagophyceae sp. CCMP2097]|nr:hypothetical protein M885DRAFT_116538 [Pelagophyceae sp. CCMP2097]
MFRARAVWWVVVALGCGAARGGADLHAGLFEPPRGVSAGVPRGMFAEPLAGHSRRVHEALVRGHGRGDDVTAECAGRLAHLRDLVASGEYHEAVELSFALEKETAWPAGCVVDEALVTTGDVLVKVSTSLDRTTSNKTVLVDVGGGSANAPKWLPLLHAHPAANATGAHAFAGAAKDASLVGFTLDGVFVASESPLRCAAAAAGASVVCSHGVTKGAPFVRHGYADADTALEASLVPARRNAALKRPAGLGSSRLVDATTSYVTGAKTLLLVPVCPRDYPCGSRWTGLAFSDPDAYFQGIATAYEAFLAKNSWGVATMTIEVAPTVEIDYDHDRCGTYEALGQLSNDAAALDTMAYAAAEAYDAGFAISNFDFRAILLPNCGSFGWSGLGCVRSSTISPNERGAGTSAPWASR